MTFETTHRDDRGELADRPDSNWTGLLLDIERQIYHLERLLKVIEREMAALLEAGVWPAEPTLFWDQDPNGQPRYAKLSFPMGALPNGQRKQYIGCKESKIQAAKAKIARTRRFWALDEEWTRLERFLSMTRSSLERVAGSVAGYRIPDDLGLDLAGDVAASGPKEWIRARPVVAYDVEEES